MLEWWRRRWAAGIRPPPVAYAVTLTAPLALSVLASKLHKLVDTDTGVGLREGVAALGADLAFLLVVGGACALALRVTARAWWYPTVIAVHVVVLTLLLVSVVDHAFFVSQGELLPGEMLAYAIRHAGMLEGVLRSKMSLGIWLCVALALVTPLLPVVVGLLVARPPEAAGAAAPTGTRRAVAGLWAASLFASLGLARLDVGADLAYLKRNTVLTLIGEALGDSAEPVATRSAPHRPRLRMLRSPNTRPHNVVFVVLESARAVSTTPYTPGLETTPFLARLARQGMLVERAYATLPHTSKALVQILCGLHPRIATEVLEALPRGIPGPCLAELLADEGYATAFVQPAEEEFERRRDLVANLGFAFFMGKESLPAAGYDDSSYFGYEDLSVVEPALDWVDRSERPFFLTVLTLTAHHDYALPRRFQRRRLAEEPGLDRYLNALSYTDGVLERLFAGFERRQLLDDTLFVVVGDHGEAFGEHGRWEHDNVLYEEGVRVPLVLFGAGVPRPGEVVSGLRETSDLLPTVAETLGFQLFGGDLQGRSLLSSSGHDRLFSSCWYTWHCMALREGHRKTVYHYERRSPELFDLRSDPLETDDLLRGTGDATRRVRRDIERMHAWRKRTNDLYRAHARATARPVGGS